LRYLPQACGPAVSPIAEAHQLPTQSAATPGLDLDIQEISTVALKQGGQVNVLIDFTAVDKNGAPYESLAGISVSADIAWPVSDYQTNVREAISTTPVGALTNNGGGSYSYQFARAFDVTSTPTRWRWKAAFRSSSRALPLTREQPRTVTPFLHWDGSLPEPRRPVIDEESCNTCHNEIRFHGEQRVGIDLCLMCHNPNMTDEARRPDDQNPP